MELSTATFAYIARHFLAHRGFMKYQSFINYLGYLMYWKEPAYVSYLKYSTSCSCSSTKHSVRSLSLTTHKVLGRIIRCGQRNDKIIKNFVAGLNYLLFLNIQYDNHNVDEVAETMK